MTNTNRVSNEMKNAGFASSVFASRMVVVSLTNRAISTMEVKSELMKSFDIRFTLVKQNNGSVLVTW